MDCVLTAFRVCSSKKLSRNDVFDAEEANLSHSSSFKFCTDEGHGATSHLRRQRAVAFFMRLYVCGVKTRATEEEAINGSAEFLFEVGLQSGKDQSRQSKEEKEVLQWWEESGTKRRKVGSEQWVAGEVNGNLLRRAPARLKRLLRRVRAKVRKMGEVQKAASFHYDPLSYSMNFDEGSWRHCEGQAKLFYGSSSANSEMPCRLQGNCMVSSGVLL